MDTKLSTNRKFKKMFLNILSIVVVLAMAFPATTVVSAASGSPFLGQWQATDVDGSDMRMAIAGRPSGPFQITWTDNYFSRCNGEAGIIRGTAWLDENDPNLLDADLELECFTTDDTLSFQVTFRYHPVTNTLSVKWSYREITIWHRPGRPQAPPPTLNLRVNYGDNWVESFYEGGHTAWVTVTEADGVTVKAAAEVTTAPRDEWGGETGFQTRPEDWVPAQPDIQPNDWVFGWVDNGASAQVQIGEIRGAVHLADDFIDGNISAPWFTDVVQVECLDWGSGHEPPLGNYDAGFKSANGEDPYACSWEAWDIQPYQNVGVGYSGPDGNWVATYFYARNPRIVASEAGDWFWMTEFNVGTLDLFLYESADEGAALLWSGTAEVTDTLGITFVGSEVHGQDMVPGNYLVVSDGANSKGLVLETITVDVFDTENEFMSGTAPLGRDVVAAAGPQEWQERITVSADSQTGAWEADFKTIGFDITEDMRGWSSAAIYDEDGDANEGSTPPPPPSTPVILNWLDWDVVEGNGWQIGDTVTLKIGTYINSALVVPSSWDPSYGYVRFDVGAEGHDLKIGDYVVMTDGSNTKYILIPPLAVTDYNLGARMVSGVYNPRLGFWIGVNGIEPTDIAFDGNSWVATFDKLDPNMWGDVVQTDADGDDVRATIHTPNPNLYALPDENKIYAQAWTAGFQLDLKIYDSNGNEVHSDSQMVKPPSAVPWTVVVFDYGDLSAGQRIVLNQRGYERELLVSSLMVTGFDLASHQVIGIGDPDAKIFIRINGEDVWGEVGEDGNWVISHPQLISGVWGEAIQPDGFDGDETRDGFQAP